METNSAAYADSYFQEAGAPSLLAQFAASTVRFLLVTLPLRSVRKALAGRPTPRVLDYGCGAGRLVGELRRAGINAVGFEPSAAARRIAAGKGIPTFGAVAGVPGGYDCIMFWHSLEHAAAPADALRDAARHLAPHGLLLIAVPNVASWEARLSGGRWFHYDYPFHRVHFTPQGLSLLLRRSGFRIRGIDFWNPEYALVGLCQTLLNFFLPANVLYGVVSHRRVALPARRARFLAMLSLGALAVASPLLLAIFAAAGLARRTGAMIAVAERY